MNNGISLDLVRDELSKTILQDLAEDLNLSYSCLYAIREGKTKWPRKKTMEVLLPVLGLTMEVVYAKS